MANTSYRYPLSESQMEVWLLSQTNADANCSCNEIATLEFDGTIDCGNLEKSLQQVVQRNDCLRTTFHHLGEYAEVHAELDPVFVFHDWSSLDAESAEQRHRELVSLEGKTPFELVEGPLLRLHFQKLSSTRSLLTVTAHHVVLDGWSLWVFCRDLGHFYDARSKGIAPQLPEPQQYTTYSRLMQDYQSSEKGKREARYWRSQFGEQFPTLDLPTDRVRPPLKTYAGGMVETRVEPETVKRLRTVAARNRSSFFQIMLAGFGAYLSRISGQDDFTVTMPTAGQSALEQHDLIGHCVNDLPIRFHIDSPRDLLELLQETRTRVINALDHQRYSIGAMIREFAPQRDPSRNPIATVEFNIDPEIKSDEIGFEGLGVRLVVEPRAFEGKEMFVNGILREDGSLDIQCQYNSDLFDEETVTNHLLSYQALLESFLDNPAAPVSGLNLLSREQQQKTIVEWNRTGMDYDTRLCVHEVIQQVVSGASERVAVEYGERSLTYRQLENLSNQVARFLLQKGVAGGDLVGVAMNRSENMLVTLLGIWKAGAGYVPMDPDYPADRLQYMCDHSRLSRVISESGLLERVSQFGKPVICMDESFDLIQGLSD